MPNRLLSTALLAAALIIPTAAFAQQQPAQPAPAAGAPMRGPHAGHRHARGWHGALRGITLSAQQKQQLKDAATQMRQSNRNADPATRRANFQKFRSTLEGILTPEQRTQFQQNVQQMRRRHEGRRPGAPAPSAPQS